MHFDPVGPEPETFTWWQNFFSIENDCRNYIMFCFCSKPECPVMKTFQRFCSPVPCSFRIHTHMHPFLQNCFHFVIALTPAFITFPVYQNCTFCIIKTEQGYFCER